MSGVRLLVGTQGRVHCPPAHCLHYLDIRIMHALIHGIAADAHDCLALALPLLLRVVDSCRHGSGRAIWES
jgi:hypothetical protein